MSMTNHFFGEKQGDWQSPKYIQSKEQACEMIDSGRYGLTEADFWILKHTGKNGGTQYDGLILSHNGCLKVNSMLPPKDAFRPECIAIDKEGFGGSLVVSYCCPAQGIYEIGEVSASNCKQGYPYAMALKRCFDRVVLKLSKMAFSGIYGEDESDSFRERAEEKGSPVLTQQSPQGPAENVPYPQEQPPMTSMPQGAYRTMNPMQQPYPPSSQPMYSNPVSAPPSVGQVPTSYASMPQKQGMDLETARAVICPTGGCKGKPMGSLTLTELKYWAEPNRFNKYPEAKQAAVTLLQYAGQ